HERGEATVPARFAEYFSESCESYEGERFSTPIQLVFPYIPAALAMAAARLFGAGALGALWAGRVANAFFLAVCAYYALSRARRWRSAIIAAALLPLTLYMGASLSYDSMFLAAALVFLGNMLAEDFTRRDLVLCCAAFAAMIAIKPVYAPLALLALALPAPAFEKLKIKRAGALGLFAASALVLYLACLGYASLAASGIEAVGNPSGADVSAQVGYVLQNPLRYAVTLMVDGWMNRFYIDQFGAFGWLDAVCGLTSALTPALIVAAAALSSDESAKAPKAEGWLFPAVALLQYAVIVTGFYCTWSAPGGTSILGVQARYFIPLIPCVLAALGRAFNKLAGPRAAVDEARRDTRLIFLCSGFALVSLAELGMVYYLS
ncbi:MAG: DUF2142 domain-containing protein, partial [Oscillospiraceae bacterium]|nr:DUF2142 domain-containing protein [Oscillospiraceae bacterium]